MDPLRTIASVLFVAAAGWYVVRRVPMRDERGRPRPVPAAILSVLAIALLGLVLDVLGPTGLAVAAAVLAVLLAVGGAYLRRAPGG